MSLPEIPDALDDAIAVAQGYASFGEALNDDGYDLAQARDAAHAAWPHLYAAALRHAADSLFQPEPSVPAAILRQAADEATA